MVQFANGGIRRRALESIADRHGKEVADLIEGIRGDGEKDPWVEYLRPTLIER